MDIIRRILPLLGCCRPKRFNCRFLEKAAETRAGTFEKREENGLGRSIRSDCAQGGAANAGLQIAIVALEVYALQVFSEPCGASKRAECRR
jgi:hypothetical protein